MVRSAQSSMLQENSASKTDATQPADTYVPTRATVARELPDGRASLSQVVSALTFALDLTEDAVPGHALRTCLLGMRIGKALGLLESELADLYYALLLKDAGCSSNSARICQILGADDRKAKSAIKTVDWTDSTLACAKWAWDHALPGSGPVRKALKLLAMSRNGESNNTAMFLARCDRGAAIALKVGLTARSASAIHALDEHWNGGGFPNHLKANAIPVLARILAIAQHLDAFSSKESRGHAIRALVNRSGIWFDPELVSIAVSLDRDGKLWNGCNTRDERDRVMDLEPGEVRIINAGQLDRVCEAFADVVDAKSPMTYRHSVGVMETAISISGHLGLAPERRQQVYRAALLHDLGKLRVPNTILDKPGSLSESEWDVVREHPLLSQQILARIPSFAGVATIVGRHHERLDGSGYPLHLTAPYLSLEDRIVATADVYSTLFEGRPYRPAMQPDEIRRTIWSLSENGKLDPKCCEAVLVSAAHMTPSLQLPSQPSPKSLSLVPKPILVPQREVPTQVYTRSGGTNQNAYTSSAKPTNKGIVPVK